LLDAVRPAAEAWAAQHQAAQAARDEALAAILDQRQRTLLDRRAEEVLARGEIIPARAATQPTTDSPGPSAEGVYRSRELTASWGMVRAILRVDDDGTRTFRAFLRGRSAGEIDAADQQRLEAAMLAFDAAGPDGDRTPLLD